MSCNIGPVLDSGGEWAEGVCGNSWGTLSIQDCKLVVGEAFQSILCLCLFVVFVVEEASQSIQVDPLAQLLEVCLQIP